MDFFENQLLEMQKRQDTAVRIVGALVATTRCRKSIERARMHRERKLDAALRQFGTAIYAVPGYRAVVVRDIVGRMIDSMCRPIWPKTERVIEAVHLGWELVLDADNVDFVATATKSAIDDAAFIAFERMLTDLKCWLIVAEVALQNIDRMTWVSRMDPYTLRWSANRKMEGGPNAQDDR